MAELTAIELCELNKQFDDFAKRAPWRFKRKVKAHRGKFFEAVKQAKDINNGVGMAVIYYREEEKKI